MIIERRWIQFSLKMDVFWKKIKREKGKTTVNNKEKTKITKNKETNRQKR